MFEQHFNIKLCRTASLNRSRIEQSREIFLETLEEYFYELSKRKARVIKGAGLEHRYFKQHPT